MTKLLVSVMDATETLEAAENGADLIDVKDPRGGSLGAASPEIWKQILQAVGNRAPVSAALGELLDQTAKQRAVETSGLTFAKVGLANCGQLSDWPSRWNAWRQCLATQTQAVAVIYADWKTCGAPSPDEVLQHLALRSQCGAVLFDTWDKRHGSLLEHCPISTLLPRCEHIRSAGLTVVLAGSLRFSQLAELSLLQPDYIAVRGAVCRGDRTGRLDGALVRQWSRALRDARELCQATR
jgi:(5-formylfuran-3-yl)methyl phosphate synthase